MTVLSIAYKRKYAERKSAIRRLAPEALIPEADRFRKTVKDLKAGGFIRFDGKTFLVQAVDRYEETDDNYSAKTGDKWPEFKLFCIETGKVHNLEWDEDDHLKVSVTEEEARFTDLKYDDGETIAQDSDDLDEIADKGWEVVYQRKTFDYKDDYAAWYYRDGADKPYKAYFYEFKAPDGAELTIEVWIDDSGREEFQVFLSRERDPDEFEILTTGG